MELSPLFLDTRVELLTLRRLWPQTSVRGTHTDVAGVRGSVASLSSPGTGRICSQVALSFLDQSGEFSQNSMTESKVNQNSKQRAKEAGMLKQGGGEREGQALGLKGPLLSKPKQRQSGDLRCARAQAFRML